jgi:coenzyme A diphosphatase NUDT7
MRDADVVEKLRRSLETGSRELDHPFLRSAVIVPLQSRNGRIQILFELRARNLRRSPGEVGFPGGRIEPGESPWQAALRELEEELGVPGRYVERLGRLAEQQRRRDELVVPFVARLPEGLEPEPDEVEVAEVFTVPLEYLLSTDFKEARLIEEYRLSEDFPRRYLPGGDWTRRLERPVRYLLFEDRLIWGLSASILFQIQGMIR